MILHRFYIDMITDFTAARYPEGKGTHGIVTGEKIDLTHKEFELLNLFLHNPNMVFSRDKLMSSIWGTDYIGETRTVDMHIKTLRQKLGAAGIAMAELITFSIGIPNNCTPFASETIWKNTADPQYQQAMRHL